MPWHRRWTKKSYRHWSRARRRVQGPVTLHGAERTQNREIVEAFLTALRRGDYQGLIAVLDPDVVVRVDEAAARPGAPREIRGAQNWARGAFAFSRAVRFAQPVLVDGSPGLVLAPRGRLARALRFTLTQGKIAQVEVIADPAHLRQLDLAVL